MPKPDLRVVHPETGEILPACPTCAALEDQVKGLERDVRAWRARNAELTRDNEAKAQMSKHWGTAVKVFDYWRLKCDHPKARFDAKRFWLLDPFITKDGPRLCCIAILGAAFDPFITTRRNGTDQRHNGFELIFRDRQKFEDFCSRAPQGIADAKAILTPNQQKRRQDAAS